MHSREVASDCRYLDVGQLHQMGKVYDEELCERINENRKLGI
ncbi:protein of unknown function [Nitrospina watsonii]|uniref:Uncharacterized protein n=1 Tax=Nitrospina watsonii TaxID=1323948 RepID=A0ABN8VY74_9BACT|nr:protein of unknown function [Nitrospina watsonii]